MKSMEQHSSGTIADKIEKMIFDGALRKDERLNEAKLAKVFSVSRTPVREALVRLSESGLIEHSPGRGAFVRHPSPVELMEMFEVMAELEAVAARLAANRISDQALEHLKDLNASCRLAANENSPNVYHLENEKFHIVIYQESGNRFLEQECRRLSRRLRPFRYAQFRQRGRLKQSIREHDEIISALNEADPAKAADVIFNHVAVQHEKFHDVMEILRSGTE